MIRKAFAGLGLLVLCPGLAMAGEFFTTTGTWMGDGQMATGAEAPVERGRCRVEIKPAEDAPGDVSVTGNCAVAAGKSDISLRVVRAGPGKVNAGFWSAATGQTIQLSGTETPDQIDLSSTTPLIVDDKAYETQLRVTVPDDESFVIRQILRGEGEETWRLVAEMTYHRVDG